MIDAHVNIEKRHIDFGCLMKDTSDHWHRQAQLEPLRDTFCTNCVADPTYVHDPMSPERTSLCCTARPLHLYWQRRKVLPAAEKVHDPKTWTVIGSMVFHEA